MKKIFITGVSGTGKTTVAEELEKRGIHAISIDEAGVCSWIDKQTGQKVDHEVTTDDEFIRNHDWICNVPQLIELMERGDGVAVVLGSASNQKDLLHLFDKILLLQCPPEVFIKRIENRTNNDFGKDKTAQEFILGWYQSFEKEMLDAGAISIDATHPLEKVVEQALEEIQS